jgi:choline dehydrogenase
VLEYGGTDAGPLIQMPAALSLPLNMATYDWGYATEPEPGLGGRRLHCPRGKVIGGSSSINGMVYVRGHAMDYDGWEAAGAAGWGYRHVLPYFKRLETSHGGEAGWRGTDGPLHVTRGAMANPLYAAFIEAGRQAGYPLTPDYNGRQQEGFGPMEMTVWGGRRWSAANAYLRPALERPNLDLVSRALVHRVRFEGRRAIGVEVEHGGKIALVRANREVVLAAGAINSPKLLMQSGIGAAPALHAVGIEPVLDRPGVGANLQDHLELYIQYRAKQPITLYRYWNRPMKGLIGLWWLLTKSGPGATNHFEACAFIRSRAGVPYPDIQYHFLPLAVRYDGRAAADGHGFQAHVGPMRAKSRGRVTLRAADPKAPPSIRFDYLNEPEDLGDFRRCIRLTRELLAQPAFAPHAGAELQPGAAIESDDALNDYIRANAETAYHPCGTCRMGASDDPSAVVDPACRVIGVEALRVADSSIFPTITNGNLNAPSIMVGEKAADHILDRPALPAAPADPWIHSSWRTAQR